MNSPAHSQINHIPPLLKLLFTIYKWVFVAPFLGLSTLILGSIVIVLSLFGAGNFASRVIASAWARINSAVAMIRVELCHTENFDPKTSYIIVANHQSHTDIYALYGFLDTDVKWVMKKELRAIPIFGKAAESMGHIIIDRSNTKSALGSINSVRDKMKDGMSVIFFPEGTRSKPGELRKFKKGAFRLAVELGLPIMPIAIHGTANILPTNTIDLMPGKIKMEFCKAIPTAGKNAEDVNAIAAEAHDAINSALMKN